MKCIITGQEIDELKDFTPKSNDPRDVQRAELARQDHAEELSKWEFLRVTVLRNGSPLELLTGHVAPDVDLQPGSIAVSRKGQ